MHQADTFNTYTHTCSSPAHAPLPAFPTSPFEVPGSLRPDVTWPALNSRVFLPVVKRDDAGHCSGGGRNTLVQEAHQFVHVAAALPKRGVQQLSGGKPQTCAPRLLREGLPLRS